MKITRYKYYVRDDSHCLCEICDDIEILTEQELKEKFIEEYDNLNKENLQNHELSGLDLSKEEDKQIIFNCNIKDIIGTFVDNDEYDENNDYWVSECEIEITPNETK